MVVMEIESREDESGTDSIIPFKTIKKPDNCSCHVHLETLSVVFQKVIGG